MTNKKKCDSLENIQIVFKKSYKRKFKNSFACKNVFGKKDM
jgi:hypothetical protein